MGLSASKYRQSLGFCQFNVSFYHWIESLGVSMSLHESQWVSMTLHESQWLSMSLNDSPWVSMTHHLSPWIKAELHISGETCFYLFVMIKSFEVYQKSKCRLSPLKYIKNQNEDNFVHYVWTCQRILMKILFKLWNYLH